jgi:uncharacterized protein (DUF924 family)
MPEQTQQTPPIATAHEVVRFWTEAGPDRWYRKDDAFDRDFRDRYLATHEAAARGELGAWARDADGALALLVLLDQFPRNAFRGSARTYATDALARLVAHQAARRGLHRQCADADLRQFFHLPFTHSEWLPDQERAVEMARELGGESERWARHHHGVVQRFGRFPHRNALLGRRTTAEEQAFLDQGGFTG